MDSLVPGKRSGSGPTEGIKQPGLSFRRLEKENHRIPSDSAAPPAESEEARGAVYDTAADYLKGVLDAVRERRRFSLEQGIQIVRRIIDLPATADPLLIRAINQEDPSEFLINHGINVAVFAVKLSAALGYGPQELERIGLAALLHEVGMGLIPEKLIYKQAKLDAQEYGIFKERPEFSYKILRGFGEKHAYLADTALQVHERLDGSGYPAGLKENEINVYAQIIGLVDIYEALIHSRPYREKFLHFSAIKQIIQMGKRRFQKKHLKMLLNIFSIFPLNSYVKLNSNAIGRVVETYPEQPMRPRIEVVFDSQGRRVLAKHVVNLAENSILYVVDSVAEKDIEALAAGPRPEYYLPDQPTPPSGAGPELLFEPEVDDSDVDISEKDLKPAPSGAEAVESGIDRSQAEISQEIEPEAEEAAAATVRMVDFQRRSRSRRVIYLLIVAVVILSGIGLWQSGMVDFAAKRTQNQARVAKPSAGKAQTGARGYPAKQAAEPVISGGVQGPVAAAPAKGFAAAVKAPEPPVATEIPAEASADMAPANPIRQSATPLIAKLQPLDAAAEPESDKNATRDEGQEAAADVAGPINANSADAVAPHPAFAYSIKLDAFRTVEEARQSVADYAKKGINAYWVKANLGSQGIWYRIFSGQYQTSQQAAAAAAELGFKEIAVKPTKYSTFIGAFSSPADVDREIKLLSDKGFCPYVIREGEQDRLYVGAFYTRKGALEQQADLVSRGIQSQIVER